MKTSLLFILCLVVGTNTYAQNAPCKRNDNAATVLQGTNLGFVPCATDDRGRIFLAPTPIAVAPPVSTPAWVRLAVPAATVPAAYTPTAAGVTGLSNTNPLVFCRFRNATDQPISCSASGGTNDDIYSIAAQSTEVHDWGSNGKAVNTSIVCKYTTAAATTGTFEINCHY